MSSVKRLHRDRIKVKLHKMKKSKSEKHKESHVSLEESIDKWEEVRDRGGWTNEALALHLLEVHKMHCDVQSCITRLHALAKPGPVSGLTRSSTTKDRQSPSEEINYNTKPLGRESSAKKSEPAITRRCTTSRSVISRDNSDVKEEVVAESSLQSETEKVSRRSTRKRSRKKSSDDDQSKNEEASDETPAVRITYELMEEGSPDDGTEGIFLSPSDEGEVASLGESLTEALSRSGHYSGQPKVKKPRNPPKWAISWREMVITFSCKVCDFHTTSPVFACHHLLLTHPDIVDPLHDYLNKEIIPGSEETLYNFVLETSKLKENGSSAEDAPVGNKMSAGIDELETYVVPVQHDSVRDTEQLFSSDENSDQACDEGASTEHSNDTYLSTNHDSASVTTDPGGCALTNHSEETVAVNTGAANQIPEKEGKNPQRGEEEAAEETKEKFTEFSLIEMEELIAYIRRWMHVDKHCNKCHSKIKGQRLTNLHHCAANTGVTLCEICGKYYRNNGYGNHVRQVHNKGKGKAKCKYCNKEMTASALFKHFRYVHEREQHKVECGMCGKVMSTKEHLRRHEVIHRMEMPFKCPFCQRGFSQKSNMHHHIRQHTGEQPYNCDHCPRAFTHKVSLKNHLKKQHGIDLWKQGQTGGGRPKLKEEEEEEEEEDEN